MSHVAEWKRVEILENTQRGREELKRKIEAGTTDKRFGRTAKKINLRSVIDMKNKGMTWANISKSEETLIEFKRQVQNKYGKIHTVLGLEVEKALKSYLTAIEFQERLASPESQCKSTHIEVD
ncbi:MAG: hypothetical protein WBB08_12425 [Halobacteriota archaeon]